MGGNNPNVALNTVMQDTDRLLNRSRAKKSFAGIRIGDDESKKTDSEQYDDTGLYQCKILLLNKYKTLKIFKKLFSYPSERDKFESGSF